VARCPNRGAENAGPENAGQKKTKDLTGSGKCRTTM